LKTQVTEFKEVLETGFRFYLL